MCRLAVAYSVASQERLTSRISALLDITLNDDDGMCAKCKRRVERVENHTWGRKSLKGIRNRLFKIRTFNTRHYIILTSLLYQVRTLTSHDTEKSENSPEFTSWFKGSKLQSFKGLIEKPTGEHMV